ncbi:MAG: hypothetical protein GY749_08325 [Desulfobacteraceae bacterium]|nr:hypothetical protein [Desulfobacteraceae bacterium]
MDYKRTLANILGMDPEKKMIESLLSASETEESLKSLMDEVADLKMQIDRTLKEIRSTCMINAEDWDALIERAILFETSGNKIAEERTRRRKGEIMDMVRVSLEEGMAIRDIQTIVEVMVMGMQPGEAQYLLPK